MPLAHLLTGLLLDLLLDLLMSSLQLGMTLFLLQRFRTELFEGVQFFADMMNVGLGIEECL
jgi:hypothetical protein